MTSQSQKTILAALRWYKRENLAQAKAASARGTVGHGVTAQDQFEEHMRIDDAVELALQEIVVAQ